MPCSIIVTSDCGLAYLSNTLRQYVRRYEPTPTAQIVELRRHSAISRHHETLIRLRDEHPEQQHGKRRVHSSGSRLVAMELVGTLDIVGGAILLLRGSAGVLKKISALLCLVLKGRLTLIVLYKSGACPSGSNGSYSLSVPIESRLWAPSSSAAIVPNRQISQQSSLKLQPKHQSRPCIRAAMVALPTGPSPPARGSHSIADSTTSDYLKLA